MTRAVLIAALVAFGVCGPAAAHEVRPAYLGIEQTGPAAYRITWKQPTMGEYAVHLVPHLSNGWLEKPPRSQYAAAGFLVRTWNVDAAPADALSGVTVSIEGLKVTITDTLLHLELANGKQANHILTPEAPSYRLSSAADAATSLISFLTLGIEHILTGPDHLAFVLGLLLIVRDRWMLLKTISAFTVAHSVTLAAATFGVISLPTALLNTLIALSILFVAPEVIRAHRGGTSLTIRYPWLVALLFGLVHGMGFANGLTSLGLEHGLLLGALVLFNVGVEIGQLAFVALVLLLVRAFRLMQIVWPGPVAMAPAYAIGVLGAEWTFKYGSALFGVS